MPTQVREGDWSRLLLPVGVLLVSMVACSAMPPADAGTPVAACHASPAANWEGRAASVDIVEQARRASGSSTVRLVMPGRNAPGNARVDRLEVFLDGRSIISKVNCG